MPHTEGISSFASAALFRVPPSERSGSTLSCLALPLCLEQEICRPCCTLRRSPLCGVSLFNTLFFQKSLKQRLGKSNIQARLGRPAGPLARGVLGGRGLPMGQRGLPRGAMRGGRGARALLRGGIPLRGECGPRHPKAACGLLLRRGLFYVLSVWYPRVGLFFSGFWRYWQTFLGHNPKLS